MIDDTIIDTFEKFSKLNGFKYIREPLPYRPYGRILGKLDSIAFQIYVYQSESRAARVFDTVFTTPGLNQLPKGFCIDHMGEPFINKSFDELIRIRSYDSETVTDYLDDITKKFLIGIFNQIHEIESSLFKLRCSFRLSDEEVSLSVGRFFKSFEELTEAYRIRIDCESEANHNLIL